MGWCDDAYARGEIINGISLCKNHDKAFEDGVLYIDFNYNIQLNSKYQRIGTWSNNNIIPMIGTRIKDSISPVSIEFW